MKRVALLSAALLLSVTASFGSGVLVEAESFRDKGCYPECPESAV